jgi:hypothetical protein
VNDDDNNYAGFMPFFYESQQSELQLLGRAFAVS